MQNLRPSNIKVIFQRPSCGSPIAMASGFIACTAPMVWPINCLCTSRVWVSTCQSDPSTVHVLVGCVCPPVSLTHPLSMYQSGVGVHSVVIWEEPPLPCTPCNESGDNSDSVFPPIIHQECILPILLYGSETWTLLAEDSRRLQSFHMSCQLQILWVKWYDHVKNSDTDATTSLPNVNDITAKRLPMRYDDDEYSLWSICKPNLKCLVSPIAKI